MDQYAKGVLFIPYLWFTSFVRIEQKSVPGIALIYTFFVVFHTPPQLLLAWLGGRLTDWVGRRLAPSAGQSPMEESAT